MSPKFFPTLLVVLNVAAAVVYATKGASEWRMIAYWSAAAVLNYVVTW